MTPPAVVTPASRAAGHIVMQTRLCGGISQTALAIASGMSAARLCRVEQGKCNLSAETSFVLAAHLLTSQRDVDRRQAALLTRLTELVPHLGDRRDYWLATTPAGLDVQRQAVVDEIHTAQSTIVVAPASVPLTGTLLPALLDHRPTPPPLSRRPERPDCPVPELDIIVSEEGVDELSAAAAQIAAAQRVKVPRTHVRLHVVRPDDLAATPCPYALITTGAGHLFVHVDTGHTGLFLHLRNHTAPYEDNARALWKRAAAASGASSG